MVRRVKLAENESATVAVYAPARVELTLWGRTWHMGPGLARALAEALLAAVEEAERRDAEARAAFARSRVIPNSQS